MLHLLVFFLLLIMLFLFFGKPLRDIQARSYKSLVPDHYGTAPELHAHLNSQSAISSLLKHVNSKPTTDWPYFNYALVRISYSPDWNRLRLSLQISSLQVGIVFVFAFVFFFFFFFFAL